MKMKVEIITPVYYKKPDFITGESEKRKQYLFKCAACGAELGIDFQKQIQNCWTGKTDEVTDREHEELKAHYGIGSSNKSHEGGLPVFDKVACTPCSGQYYTYSGVNEFSNSTFTVQIQGIAKDGK
ncbi:hypothetical protein [Pontibacter beigongshangensis]|uniref:hypothetical protein n=1 Tax=Pontibacter beigongshangensis TaxID=2574733 RepID=UPI00164F8027|nr:hypothetical protein [Pontibacter beigongshangensis]